MLIVALVELQKLVNWVQVVFSNLHSKLWDLSTIIKLEKENLRKETKFNVTQVINIILWNWFPIDLTFEAPKSNDEDDDNSSIDINTNVKRKGLKISSQVKPINLDNPP
jgi:hypothetical protein